MNLCTRDVDLGDDAWIELDPGSVRSVERVLTRCPEYGWVRSSFMNFFNRWWNLGKVCFHLQWECRQLLHFCVNILRQDLSTCTHRRMVAMSSGIFKRNRTALHSLKRCSVQFGRNDRQNSKATAKQLNHGDQLEIKMSAGTRKVAKKCLHTISCLSVLMCLHTIVVSCFSEK